MFLPHWSAFLVTVHNQQSYKTLIESCVVVLVFLPHCHCLNSTQNLPAYQVFFAAPTCNINDKVGQGIWLLAGFCDEIKWHVLND